MNSLRNEAKIFFNSLDVRKPINFGATELFRNGADEKFYVENLHGVDHLDPIQDLADQIDFLSSAGAYLFTGNRGTGKTTELLRLAKILQGDDYNCEVFYVDIAEYLYMADPVEISDFLITVMGALSDKFHERFKEDPTRVGYFERILDLLKTEVLVSEVKLAAGPADFKLAFKENPNFKRQLQQGTRGIVEKIVQQARDFALYLKERMTLLKSNPDRKIVLIVDSFERIGGNFENARDVFASVETLFSSQASNLRFSGLNIVYTVPPYLSALSGGLGAYYAGGRIYTLPTAHIYNGRPSTGQAPECSADGVGKMAATVKRRYPGWQTFFTETQLERLARSSGGDLRDYFRMLTMSLVSVQRLGQFPIPDELIKSAEDEVRRDMALIAETDRVWLAKIMHSHDHELDDRDKLPDFARLQQGKYVLQYQNGEDWYDIHPLLREKVSDGGGG